MITKIFKSILALIGILLLDASLISAQNTAVDFTANDCSSNSHHLFAELDAGKTIVLVMVHPCSSCIGPSKSALSIVNSYNTSNPGKVIYYLTDDIGNTSCSTLNTWASTNGISGVVTLSDPAINELDYGVSAMPKIVVVSGTDHKVIFTQDNGLNATNMKNAIDQALAKVGIDETFNKELKLRISPNPVQSDLTLYFTLKESASVGLEIYNILGTKVKSIASVTKSSGDQSEYFQGLDELNNGVYFLALNIGSHTQMIKFCISH